MRFTLTMTAAVVAAAMAAPAWGQNVDRAEVALHAAMKKESVDGDLKGAIEQYKKLAQGANKPVAARALVRLGECYEKQGNADARKTYEQVLSRFGDQKEAVEQARARLAALGRGSEAPASRRLYVRTNQFWQQGAPSSDGRYHARDDDKTGDLVLQDLTTGEQRRLTSFSQQEPNPLYGGIVTAIFSRDNQWIAYTLMPPNGAYEMRLINVDGTGDRLVYKTSLKSEAAWLHPVSFTPDGSRILVTFNRRPNLRLYHVGMVDVKDGAFRTIREMAFGDVDTRASLSPDGRYVAFDYVSKEGTRERDIAVIDLQTNQETKVVEHAAHDANPLWTPDGKALVFESDRNGSRSLWIAAIANGKPASDPVLLKTEIPDANIIGFDRKGTLYYLSSFGTYETSYVPFDSMTGRFTGNPQRLKTAYENITSPAVSPDGSTLAYLARTGANERKGESPMLVLEPLNGGEPMRISLPLVGAYNAVWLPDGRELAVFGPKDRDRKNLGFVVVRVASGETRWIPTLKTLNERTFSSSSTCSPAEGKLYYSAYGSTAGGDANIYWVDPRTGDTTSVYSGSMGIQNVCPSPDGKWVAFSSWKGGDRDHIYVLLSSGGEPKLVRESMRSKEGHIAIGGWSADSQSIYYYSNRKNKPGIYRLALNGGEPEHTQPAVDKTTPVRVTAGRWVTLSKQLSSSSELWAMENLLPRR